MTKVPLSPVILNHILRYVLIVDNGVGHWTTIHDARDTPMYWKIALTSKQFLHALVLEYHDIMPIGAIRVTKHETHGWLENRTVIELDYSSIVRPDVLYFKEINGIWVPKVVYHLHGYDGLRCFHCNGTSLRSRRRDTLNNIGATSTKVTTLVQAVAYYAGYKEGKRQYIDILCMYCVQLLWYGKVDRLRALLN